MIDDAAAGRFVDEACANPINEALIERLPALGLPDCWLVAGCLFQTVWNGQAGRPASEKISDYDVFYFDPADTSYEAEDLNIRRLAAAFADLDVRIELKNQARVHLWYPLRFGRAYSPLSCSTEGIDRFLVRATCVGVDCSAATSRAVYASFGLEEMYAGLLGANPRNVAGDRFAEKALSYQARWPWLRIV